MNEVTIPIEDGTIPDGWEPERIGLAKLGETIVRYNSDGIALPNAMKYDSDILAIIIRKKYDPGIDCIPKGWWVWNDGDEWIASKEVGNWENAVCGLQSLLEFTSTPDGKPRQIC